MWVVQQNPWSCISQNWHRTCVPSHERTLVLHRHVQKIVSRSLSREQQLLTMIVSACLRQKRNRYNEIFQRRKEFVDAYWYVQCSLRQILFLSVAWLQSTPEAKHTLWDAIRVAFLTKRLQTHTGSNMETKWAVKRVPWISWAGAFQANSWLRDVVCCFCWGTWLPQTSTNGCCPWQCVLAYSGCGLPLFPLTGLPAGAAGMRFSLALGVSFEGFSHKAG